MKLYDLDHAATTALSPLVYKAMQPYMKHDYGNPSSMHKIGIHNKKAVNDAKKGIASLLNCSFEELIFTASGTEATNLAIKGYALSHPDKKEIITTPIEHKATLNTCLFLEKMGYKIKYIKIDSKGFIDLEDLKKLITDQTLLVSIIWANNEIGVIQDINGITKITQEKNVALHMDAVQMIGHFPIDLSKLDIDFVSISAHKFFGPKGVGLLYKNKKRTITPLIHGGSQEFGLRSGTDNVYGIIGLYEALKLSYSVYHHKQEALNVTTKKLFEALKREFAFILNGPDVDSFRLPGLLSCSFEGKLAHRLQYALNKQGLYVSTGSACRTDSIEVSHVIKALHDKGEGTVRLSLGYDLEDKDIDMIVSRFRRALED